MKLTPFFVAFVMSTIACIAAGQTNSISSIPPSIGWYEGRLAQYQLCEPPQAFLAKRDRDGAKAWQTPLGIVVLEYTPGALIVLRGTLFVSVEDGVKQFAIASIEPTRGKMVIQLPGERERYKKGPMPLMWEDDNLMLRASTEKRESETRSSAVILRPGLGPRRGEAVSLLTERYGQASVSGEGGATNALDGAEVLQWKVGDGYLEIEITLGAGIVKEITYVIGDQKDKSHKKLKVNNVDLTKGEMTIELPGNADGEGKRKESP
jgi:hypothetical protein